jgi:hypothetical protein
MWRAEHTRDMKNTHKIFIGKLEAKTPLVRSRCRWKDNMKHDLKEMVCGRDASGSGYGPVAGCFEHGNEPSVSTKAGSF